MAKMNTTKRAVTLDNELAGAELRGLLGLMVQHAHNSAALHKAFGEAVVTVIEALTGYSTEAPEDAARRALGALEAFNVAEDRLVQVRDVITARLEMMTE